MRFSLFLPLLSPFWSTVPRCHSKAILYPLQPLQIPDMASLPNPNKIHLILVKSALTFVISEGKKNLNIRVIYMMGKSNLEDFLKAKVYHLICATILLLKSFLTG